MKIVQGRRERSSCYAKIATWLETVELILYIAVGHSKQKRIPVRTKPREKKSQRSNQVNNSPRHRRNDPQRLSKFHKQGSSCSLLCTTFSNKLTVCFDKLRFGDIHRIQHISVPYLIEHQYVFLFSNNHKPSKHRSVEESPPSFSPHPPTSMRGTNRETYDKGRKYKN